MNRVELFEQICSKSSFLCIGLDTDINLIPKHLHNTLDPIFEFNKAIIDATQDLCVAYKPNIAFYESLGRVGWSSLEKTLDYIPNTHFRIADAKRGDIGNTSRQYAKAFFEILTFDALTVAPYMGADSVTPFLTFPNKWVILLALTSNEGSKDFQFLLSDKQPLFEHVLETSKKWGNSDNLMFVVGATHPAQFQQIRRIVPDYFLLVPGLGAQGGDLNNIARFGMNKQCGLLVNASRSILYASSGLDFAEQARAEALKIQQQMRLLLEEYL